MFLYEELNGKIVSKTINELKYNFSNSPQFITKSINQKFCLRDYQIDAIVKMDYVFNENLLEDSTLLFNMATGSGKTLLMATNILYLYSKGYRNFIFFVNQTAILSKTRDNFLNKKSSKYLFNNEIIYNGKRVEIQEVEYFFNKYFKADNYVLDPFCGSGTTLVQVKKNLIQNDFCFLYIKEI